MYKNSEGYSDPTAGDAFTNIILEERKETEAVISDLMKNIRYVAGLAGFDVVNRIQFKERKTGKIFK